jgi:hypothetical protein
MSDTPQGLDWYGGMPAPPAAGAPNRTPQVVVLIVLGVVR